MKTEAYWKGRDAKQEEIREMGFEASRDKFNMDYPVGIAWSGSQEGLQYAHGEFSALVDAAK